MASSVVVPSFPVQNFQPINYPGGISAVNVQLLTTSGSVIAAANNGQQIVGPSTQSQLVNTAINWWDAASFAAGGRWVNACSINLQQNNSGASSILNKILMCYINNVNNGEDVTVYFPDSGMFVTASSGTSGYYPVMTNQFNCYVYNGYTGSGPVPDQGLTGITQILFCNFAIPGFVTQAENDVVSSLSLNGNVTSVGIISIPFNGTQIIKIYNFMADINLGNATSAGACDALFGMTTSGLGATRLASFSIGDISTAAGSYAPHQPHWNINWNATPFLYNGPLLGPLEIVCDRLNNISALELNFTISYTVR